MNKRPSAPRAVLPGQRPFRLKRAALRASPGSAPAGPAKPKSLREWSRVFFIRGEPNQLIEVGHAG
ncbi:MAG: hypothetical protein ACJ74Y_07040 [Bryobacteraceae bacterium]